MTKTGPPVWTKDRQNILAPEISSKIKGAFERGLVFGYHSIYCGGCSLNTWVFKAFEDFVNYVQSHAKPGDLFTVWSVYQLLERNLQLFSGKHPESEPAAVLIVPPAELQRVKEYLDFIDPKYAPHRMNEIHAIYSCAGDQALEMEIINLTYDDDWDEFLSKLRAYSRPGAEVHLFPVGRVDSEENIFVSAKYPNERGEVPIGGAY